MDSRAIYICRLYLRSMGELWILNYELRIKLVWKIKTKLFYRLQPNNSSGRVGKGRGSLVLFWICYYSMSSQKTFERLSECRMIFAFCRVDKSRSMVRLLTPNLLAIFSTVNPPLFPPKLRISSMITFVCQLVVIRHCSRHLVWRFGWNVVI